MWIPSGQLNNKKGKDMIKVNLGCGNVPLVGYVNIDKYYYPGSDKPLNDNTLAETWNTDHPDSIWESGDLVSTKYTNNTFDEVMMVHALEHVSMEEGMKVIKEAYRICKIGGIVEIEVPDLKKACERILVETPNTQEWYRTMGCIYGTSGADGEGQFHLCGYTPEHLMLRMKEIGFKELELVPVGFGHGNNQEGHPEPEFDFRVRGVK